jgi:hypothetical protein
MVVLLHVTPLHTILSRYLTLHRTHHSSSHSQKNENCYINVFIKSYAYYTVKPASAATSMKQSLALKGYM